MPNNQLASVFWKNVTRNLLDQKMSLSELADRSGLSQQSLSSAKSLSSALRVGTVIRISNALGVTPSSLLNIYDGPNPDSLMDGVLEKAIVSTPEEAVRLVYPCLSSTDKNTLIRIANVLRGNN